MKKEILINSTMNEVRVAITEDGKLAEFFIELPDKERYIGNIYLGKVNKVVQGLNAAFINVGLSHDAFLHFSDVDESLEKSVIMEDEEDEDAEFIHDFNLDASFEKPASTPAKPDSTAVALRKSDFTAENKGKLATFRTKRSGQIHINLKPKQDVIVQVVREAYHNKGVKVTTKVAVPGQYLVLLPFDTMLGVSRKIASFQERRRLRQIKKSIPPRNYGCIIRTAAKGKSEEDLRRDWENLVVKWEDIKRKLKRSKPPELLYQDIELATSVIRDLFTPQVQKVVIDSKKLYKEIISYLKENRPNLVGKVEHYNGSKSIFEHFGIEDKMEEMYHRKVNLPGGGSIVIEPTEAMTVIDVNSGRSAEKDQEKNAVKTNMEAAREISRQLRLRDIGGMIIVDYIDMQHESNKKKLFAEMKKAMSPDRAKYVLYPLSQLGLMQITRQRINQNIEEKLRENCPMCNGTGKVISKIYLLNVIERWLKNFRAGSREFRLKLIVHPHMAQYLTEGPISRISRLMIKYFIKIKIEQDEHLRIDDFRFHSVRHRKDITNEYL
ncbi:MAG: Rne/Rng family ribonuclease [Candidatus Kapaibacterium sp.]